MRSYLAGSCQSDLKLIDSCEYEFYNKVLGFHNSTRNRLVIIIAGTTFSVTEAFSDYVEVLERNLWDIGPEFFKTPVFTQRNWKAGKCKKRHLIAKASLHEFHFKMCQQLPCFDWQRECLSKFCTCQSASCVQLLSIVR